VFSSSHIHSPPFYFLVSLHHFSSTVCKQIPAHVIRCLHHSSAFTAPVLPSTRQPPPLPSPLLPLQLHAIIEVASEQMADRQMWKQAVVSGCDMIVIM